MEVKVNRTTLRLVQGDITDQTTDAIVNAANSSLMGGGGVDGAIHRAGGSAILEACKQIVSQQGPLAAGDAVITTGGRLAAMYVIHTVGPVWHGGKRGEPDILASAYRQSLRIAADNGLRSVSFPSISTGAYGYPIDQAAVVALQTVISFADEDTSVHTVVFVLYDAATNESYGRTLARLMPGLV